MLQIGDYEIEAVNNGLFALDGGAMFGVIPKPLWEKSNPADEKNRIELALRCLLIRGNGRVILVDTGMGDKWTEKEKAIYKIPPGTQRLKRALAKCGVVPEKITDVFLSHLHFDHTGGTTYLDNADPRTSGQEQTEMKLTFPEATHHVQLQNWEWAFSPCRKEMGSYRQENFELLKNSDQLNLLDGEVEALPGISVRVCQGHTFGMQLPVVSDGQTTLIYLADLIPTRTHLRLPYVMGYDNQPLKALEEKQKILNQATEENWILFYEHDPVVSASRVIKKGNDFVAGEVVDI